MNVFFAVILACDHSGASCFEVSRSSIAFPTERSCLTHAVAMLASEDVSADAPTLTFECARQPAEAIASARSLELRGFQ